MYLDRNQFQNNNYLPEEYRTLFLGDLSIHCTRQDILNLFAPFGTIERITLKVGVAMTGLGYGFISFAEAESANRAMEALQGSILLGRALRIKWATPRGQPNLVKYEPEYKSQQSAEVHFSFMTKDIHYVITEEIIRRQYEQFGEIIDIVIKRSKIDPNIPLQNGYGFVRYRFTSEGLQAAINAKKYMHQVQIDGIGYDTHFTHALESYLMREYPEVLMEVNPHRSMQQQQYYPQQQQQYHTQQQPYQQPSPAPLTTYAQYPGYHSETHFNPSPVAQNLSRNISPHSTERTSTVFNPNTWHPENSIPHSTAPSIHVSPEDWLRNPINPNQDFSNAVTSPPPTSVSIATTQSSNSNLPTARREDREAFSTYFTTQP